MGDDVLDLPVVQRAGLSACPSDAAKEMRMRVDYVSPRRGGDGAVRDLIELVLRSQGRWKALLKSQADEQPDRLGASSRVSRIVTPARAGARPDKA